jgi:hypothetical protein
MRIRIVEAAIQLEGAALTIIVPVWKPAADNPAIPNPPCPSDLGGKTIGLLHNIKKNGDVLLEHYAAAIVQAHPDVDVVRARKPHSAMGMTEHERAALARCDLVLVALAD